MTDIFSKDKRSKLMAAIKGKNTATELLVFRYLRRNKVYFQKHYKRAPGSPDIALPRKKKAVFIDGDFWHGKTMGRLIKKRGRADFWTKKIQRNMERDKEQEAELLAMGWKILRIWEADILRKRTQLESLKKIESFLNEDNISTTAHPSLR